MAKKQEDNRDVFEKIMDNIPAIAGGAVGSLALRGRSLKAKKALRDYEKSPEGRRMREMTSVDGDYPNPLYAGNRDLRNKVADASSHRVMATAIGAGAGALGQKIYEDGSRKRRK